MLLLLLLLLRCHRVSLVLVRVARAPRAQFWSMDAADEEQPTRTSGGNEELICEEAASELLQQHGFLLPSISSDIIELPAQHGGGHVNKHSLVAELKSACGPVSDCQRGPLVKLKAQAAGISCDSRHHLAKLFSHFDSAKLHE